MSRLVRAVSFPFRLIAWPWFYAGYLAAYGAFQWFVPSLTAVRVASAVLTFAVLANFGRAQAEHRRANTERARADDAQARAFLERSRARSRLN